MKIVFKLLLSSVLIAVIFADEFDSRTNVANYDGYVHNSFSTYLVGLRVFSDIFSPFCKKKFWLLDYLFMLDF